MAARERQKPERQSPRTSEPQNTRTTEPLSEDGTIGPQFEVKKKIINRKGAKYAKVA